MSVAVLIPAFRPAVSLLKVVRALVQRNVPAIVLVDDGSGPEFRGIFDEAAALPNVHVLRHSVNRGKGAALKTAIDYALLTFPDLAGVVTADADGQHHPDDIEAVTKVLQTQPQSLVLGVRGFQGEVPLRSRVGNTVTRWLMHALLGQKVSDTQTGLRGIPKALLPQLLSIDANGYEFELEMLIAAHRLGVPLVEQPIRTIYDPGNPSSHFNPIVDSMKIYFVLLRFASVSLLTAVIDNAVFYVAYRRTGNLLASQVLGRSLAVAFNYTMVRRSVFGSRQRHLAVLPQYLLLVVASGAVSYGGIRLLVANTPLGAIPAKLLVETTLFFANFAVQRLFIFSTRKRPPRSREQRRTLAISLAVAVVVAAAVVVEAYGFATVNLFVPYIWWPNGTRRLIRYGCVFAEFGLPLLLMAPWAFAGTAAAALIALTALAAPAGLAASGLFLLSAWALGSKILRRGSAGLRILLGTGIYMFAMTLVARMPIHYPAVWAAVLAVPIVMDPRHAWSGLKNLAGGLRCAQLRTAGERAGFALLAFLIGMHWLVALQPETSADGLAMHLAVSTNMAAHHRLTYEPVRFLWSVMPMGGDWAYAIAYQLGGEIAPKLLNFAMLLVLLRLLYELVRRFVSRAAAFVLLAAFAATPLVQLVTGGLFVENLLAAMLLGAFTAWWRFSESGDKRFLFLTAALGGFSLGIKVGAFAFIGVLLPFAIAAAVRHRIRIPAAALALGLFVAAAAPTFAIAWGKTGNPVFPFYNQKFPSPLLEPAVSIRELRFRQPLRWQTPFDLTFHTSRFYEGQDGSFGFQYLLLIPLAALAAWPVRNRLAQAGAVVALGAMVLVLRSEPNARYLYSELPLLFVPTAALLEWLREHRRALYRTVLTLLLACAMVDVHFLPASGWSHRQFYSQLVFKRGGRERLLREDIPLRDVVRHFSRQHPGDAVLVVGENDIADVAGDAYVPNWHQYSVWQKVQSTRNRLDLIRLLRDWKIRYFIAPERMQQSPELARGLRDLMARCKSVEYENNGFFAARIAPACIAEAEGSGAEAAAANPGTYDDFDIEVRYRGDWERAEDFAAAYASTESYTDAAGADAEITFDGRAVTYVFAKAPNRGMAEIRVDGAARATLDLYSPNAEWQSRYRICCLAPGRHTIAVRVLGKSRAEATGKFVDVDAFIVE